MATSAIRHRGVPRVGKPLLGFVVGKYFAMLPDSTPDHVGIDKNIEAAVEWSIKLWQEGYLVFTPHLNTHHFEAKTRIYTEAELRESGEIQDGDNVVKKLAIKNEKFYQAFDRRLLAEAVDFIFATPNWRNSTGGRMEIQLACSLGIPVFESVRDLNEWARGGSNYSTVHYGHITEEAKHFGEQDVKLLLIDGPYWAQDGAEPDMARIRGHAKAAEDAAVKLFNNKVAVFTPHLNSFCCRLGWNVPLHRVNLLSNEILSRLADGVYLLPGWHGTPATRARIGMAQNLEKPVFESLNEVITWRSGGKDYATVRLG